jgi:hypothetical protein
MVELHILPHMSVIQIPKMFTLLTLLLHGELVFVLLLFTSVLPLKFLWLWQFRFGVLSYDTVYVVDI